jgi:hypothetical protein
MFQITRSKFGSGIRGKTNRGLHPDLMPLELRRIRALDYDSFHAESGRAFPPPYWPSDPPRRDRPTRQISDCPPNSPDHALRFTAIRASERSWGMVAFPALSGPLPRSAITNASARNPRHDAPRGAIRPRRQSTKRPASTSRPALKQLHGVCLGRSAPLMGWNPPSK